MPNDLCQATQYEVVAKLRRSYAKAGAQYKRQRLDQAVALLGYYRRARVGWRWTRWPCAAVVWMTATLGCSPRWPSAPTGRSSGRGEPRPARPAHPLRAVKANLPFPLRGIESDNGGEFISHPVEGLAATTAQAAAQRAVQGGAGAVAQPLPAHAQAGREKETGRPAQRAGVWRGAETPDARVLPAADVSPAKQAQLQDLHASLNPLQLGREIGRRKQERSATRAAGLKSNGRWLTPPALQRREERSRTNPGGPGFLHFREGGNG